jgi:UDP-glucose 4-epimerase
MMQIMVTGGAGYIGSHTAVELLQAGYDVVMVDNFSNSKPDVPDRVKAISGRDFIFYEADVTDRERMDQIFQENQIEAVIHFAGYKAVGESVREPLKYYQNNILSTVVLCEVMANYGCRKIVFSSSATVYGNPEKVPIREDFPLSATNPYGRTKLINENLLRDLHHSDNRWRIALLRYFNPAGAHWRGPQWNTQQSDALY